MMEWDLQHSPNAAMANMIRHIQDLVSIPAGRVVTLANRGRSWGWGGLDITVKRSK